jgi:hypothetical protein
MIFGKAAKAYRISSQLLEIPIKQYHASITKTLQLPIKASVRPNSPECLRVQQKQKAPVPSTFPQRSLETLCGHNYLPVRYHNTTIASLCHFVRSNYAVPCIDLFPASALPQTPRFWIKVEHTASTSSFTAPRVHNSICEYEVSIRCDLSSSLQSRLLPSSTFS